MMKSKAGWMNRDLLFHFFRNKKIYVPNKGWGKVDGASVRLELADIVFAVYFEEDDSWGEYRLNAVRFKKGDLQKLQKMLVGYVRDAEKEKQSWEKILSKVGEQDVQPV